MAIEEREFNRLNDVIKQQQKLISSIATKLEQLESIGGGSASIEDYQSNKKYKRNVCKGKICKIDGKQYQKNTQRRYS